MKDIKPRLVELFKKGYCTPQIARIAKELKEPSTTIHYNIKKLEEEKKILSFKAVFDYKKIDEGFCAYALVNLNGTEYNDPEEIAEYLAKKAEIESIDMITGDWELLLKIRTKNQDEYYNFVKQVLSRKGIGKITTMVSLKQPKTEFVRMPY